MAIAKKRSHKSPTAPPSKGTKKNHSGLFKKGAAIHVGRAKGTPNKITRTLKELIVHGYENANKNGAEAYFTDLARNEKDLFVPLVGKLLPLTMNMRSEHQHTVKISYETREDIKARWLAAGKTPEKIALLEAIARGNNWKPTPVSKRDPMNTEEWIPLELEPAKLIEDHTVGSDNDPTPRMKGWKEDE